MIRIRATRICSICHQRKNLGLFALAADGSHISDTCETCTRQAKQQEKVAMQIKVLKKNPAAKLPSYATPGASGLDLHACIPHPIYLQPGVRFTCPTGIGIEIPEGFVGYVCSRSGIAKKNGVSVLNAPGVIDSDFVGEICVILINHGDEAFLITPESRIAQLVIAPVQQVDLILSESLKETERGEGGFGHTGV